MALRIRVRPGPNNDQLLASLDRPTFERGVQGGKKLFSLVLVRALVEKTHSRTRTGTGNMARRWKVRPTKEGLLVTNTARGAKRKPYPVFIEWGTKAHFVEPLAGRVGKNGRPPALAWRKSGKGPMSAFKSSFNPKMFFFSKGHRVSGIKARRIIPAALDAVGHRLGELIHEQVEEELS